MIQLTVNDVEVDYEGDENLSLLNYLRNDLELTSVKDGCSGQAACGACTVEINGEAKLSCVTKMSKLNNAKIYTPEGFPEYVKDTIAKALVNEGAVQCGFCTPGFISRTKILLDKNPNPTLDEVRTAVKSHICRCTGYKKIEKGILAAAQAYRNNEKLEIRKTSGKIGVSQPKYQAYETAIGERKFVDDMKFEEMLYSALKFSDYPSAKVIKIDYSEAEKLEGVIRIFTSKDIPGEKKVGLILQDWNVMIAEGQKTNYIGDVLAGVVAETEAIARKAVELINIEYEVFEPVTDVFKAIDADRIHADRPNNFDTVQFTIGDAETAMKKAKYTAKGNFETQRIEHGFLEKESAIARPDGKGGLELFSQSQGVYEDRRQVAMILGLSEDNVRVTLVPNGGGFGGKEDAFLLEKPVKLTLSREESYTNNIPCGAMRGFGANQVTFALEVCVDEICEKGGFDRWQFRYDNALVDGLKTSTGQIVYGVGIRKSLLAIKDDFYSAKYAGIAAGIKNSGVGNGMVDESKVIIQIVSEDKIILHHGWTEMGQGVHNMALQTLCEETGFSPDIIEVIVDTESQIKTGMTTSSRATALVGLAVINAAKTLNEDLKTKTLAELSGKKYNGQFTCDWTNKPTDDVENPVVHYSYGYAAQLCILDDEGNVDKFIAANDAGKIMNPMLFEGQIEGGVHMGLGYALTEDLPMKDGYLESDKYRKLGILRAHETPEIIIKGVEVKDPIGPYGAKGVGEIGLVPTAGAVANALYQFDKIRRYKLPLKRK